jgi:Alpha/beta hydrolase domain
MLRRLVSVVMCALVGSVGLAAVAGADAASPTVTPATGGNGVPVLFGHTSFDLASVGYEQSEFFLEGSASAYSPASPLTSDGKWAVTGGSPQQYTTRVVVNRPIDDRKFNGAVVVEWLNVSGGVDASPDWIHMHDELVRRGYAWVGVSAQAVGVNQLKCPGVSPSCPAPGDPARYATLMHPGDSYSYDIFSQAGQAVRSNAQTVLGGLHPDRLIAAGESQSAGRMVTYIDAVHPLVRVYDGFVVHSRGAGGAALSQAPLPAVATPTPTFIRDDLNVPVLILQTETDAGGLQARQADSPRYRLWEVAGTSHFDQYGLVQGATDTGDRQAVAAWFDSMQHPTNQPSPNFTCSSPINTGPATFVLRSAIGALNRWVADGTAPPVAPRLQTVSIQPLQYATDGNGNVLGGVRTPAVDTPVAKLSGLGQSGSQFCVLFGTTTPFTPDQLAALYKNHEAFVSAWGDATQDAVKARFLVREDADLIRVVGAQSDIGN